MESAKESVRALAVHLTACAFSNLFNDAELVVGEATECGFYCDFAFDRQVDSYHQLCVLLDEEIRALTKNEDSFRSLEMMRENCAQFFSHRNQQVKAQIAALADHNILTLIQIGDYYDLAIPLALHAEFSRCAVKILSIQKCDLNAESVGVLPGIRVYGAAESDQQQLKQFLKKWRQAQKADHRHLGVEMGLFQLPSDRGELLFHWLPKGAILRELIHSVWVQWRDQLELQPVVSAPIISAELFSRSDQIRPTVEMGGNSYLFAAPLAVAHADLFFAQESKKQSMPVRYAEWGYGYRPCSSGRLSGLLYSRFYSQDFCHIFCTAQQLPQELTSPLRTIVKTVNIMGFEHYWQLTSSVEGASQSYAEKVLIEALRECQIPFRRTVKKGVEGPCATAIIIDGLGREWQGPYLGVNLQVARQCQLRYRSGNKGEVYMVSSSLLGPLERYIALMIERGTGVLPFWLAPEQVRLIAVTAAQRPYALELLSALRAEGLRASFDEQEVGVAARVHAAEMAKIPYLAIVGEREEKSNTVAVRPSGKSSGREQVAFAAWCAELRGENQLPSS